MKPLRGFCEAKNFKNSVPHKRQQLFGVRIDPVENYFGVRNKDTVEDSDQVANRACHNLCDVDVEGCGNKLCTRECSTFWNDFSFQCFLKGARGPRETCKVPGPWSRLRVSPTGAAAVCRPCRPQPLLASEVRGTARGEGRSRR